MATSTMPGAGFFEKHREKIDFNGPGGCWNWLGSKVTSGHGHVRFNGDVRLVSRVVWMAENGSIPEGMVSVTAATTLPAAFRAIWN